MSKKKINENVNVLAPNLFSVSFYTVYAECTWLESEHRRSVIYLAEVRKQSERSGMALFLLTVKKNDDNRSKVR